MYSPPSRPLYDTNDLRPSTIHSTSVLPPSLPPASGRTLTLTMTFPLPSFCADCLSVAGMPPETASAMEISSPMSSNVVADAYDPCAEEFLLRGEGGFKSPLLDSRGQSGNLDEGNGDLSGIPGPATLVLLLLDLRPVLSRVVEPIELLELLALLWPSGASSGVALSDRGLVV